MVLLSRKSFGKLTGFSKVLKLSFLTLMRKLSWMAPEFINMCFVIQWFKLSCCSEDSQVFSAQRFAAASAVDNDDDDDDVDIFARPISLHLVFSV